MGYSYSSDRNLCPPTTEQRGDHPIRLCPAFLSQPDSLTKMSCSDLKNDTRRMYKFRGSWSRCWATRRQVFLDHPMAPSVRLMAERDTYTPVLSCSQSRISLRNISACHTSCCRSISSIYGVMQLPRSTCRRGVRCICGCGSGHRRLVSFYAKSSNRAGGTTDRVGNFGTSHVSIQHRIDLVVLGQA